VQVSGGKTTWYEGKPSTIRVARRAGVIRGEGRSRGESLRSDPLPTVVTRGKVSVALAGRPVPTRPLKERANPLGN
jgi:hypothetical protein